ncbi:hypothetical protein Q8F55_008326 [Vanrija albida]|uniref:Peptidase A1 domain-containing protein n=1 Tax=Vanrija albida TaxID=181172 RepID=A0ABR3PVX0_9TREE
MMLLAWLVTLLASAGTVTVASSLDYGRDPPWTPSSSSPWFRYRTTFSRFSSASSLLTYAYPWTASCSPDNITEGVGNSQRTTTTPGAFVTLTFGGIGAFLRVKSVGPGNSTVTSFVDGVPGPEYQVPVLQDEKKPFLITATDLVNTNHTLDVAFASGPGLIVEEGYIFVPGAPPAVELSMAFLYLGPLSQMVESDENPAFNASDTGSNEAGLVGISSVADWSEVPCVANMSCGTNGTYLESNKSGAWVAFTTPQYTAHMGVYGWNQPHGGQMDLVVTPAPPLDTFGLRNDLVAGGNGSRSIQTIRQGLGEGLVGCRALDSVYSAQLDRAKTYLFNATCAVGPGQKCSFGFAALHIAHGPEPVPLVLPQGSNSTEGTNSSAGPESHPSTTNKGAIAGGVVGGVVLLAAVGGLLAWLVRRRRRHGAKQAEEGDEAKLAHEDEPSGEQGAQDAQASDESSSSEAHAAPDADATPPSAVSTETRTESQRTAYTPTVPGTPSHAGPPPPPRLPAGYPMRNYHLPPIDTGAALATLALPQERGTRPSSALTTNSSERIPPLIAELKSGSPLISSDGTPVTARSGRRSIVSALGRAAPEPAPLVGIHRAEDEADVRLAEDAGRLRADELPPQYNPQWRDDEVVGPAPASGGSSASPGLTPVRGTPPSSTPPPGSMTPLETVMERPSVELQERPAVEELGEITAPGEAGAVEELAGESRPGEAEVTPRGETTTAEAPPRSPAT